MSTFGAVVVREVLDEFTELALILDIHGLDGVHGWSTIPFVFLSHYERVDVGIIVESDAEG